ncbi:YqaA family protein [Limnohabitans sp. Rim8]|uniref:YqaA family protein n=1 Tax=Limnohabitans sp. Rim8 TaxID=1100718 RepID=UPI00330570AC
METWIHSHIAQLLGWLSLPEIGLSTVFIVSFISATLLPLGSEPAVFGLIKLNPELFWAAILVATTGNTLGGMFSWLVGFGAHKAVGHKLHSASDVRALQWLKSLGPKACLLAWLPVVGDPLCAMAGWLKLPLWPCALYMLIGKFLRYLVMTVSLLWIFPSQV